MIRTNYDLNHGDLGTLDPASESARLATLGLRGVAATILWQRAEFYKREKYFDRLAATVNQLRILQPHFVKVWEFQAHNLAWNVSVEFDDYRQRYEWVKKGVFFLIDGSKYNKTRTEMPFELGWAFGNKLGMSDERRTSQLYREDRNFTARWNSSATWISPSSPARDQTADLTTGAAAPVVQPRYEMVEAGSLPARSPLMFYCKAPQWQYKHAEAVQSEGYLGEEARTAWRLASLGWHGFGQRQIRTTYGTTIFLNELDAAQEQLSRAEAEFQQLAGEVYSQAAAQRRAALTEDQRAVLDKDSELLTLDDLKIIDFVRQAAKVSPASLVDQRQWTNDWQPSNSREPDAPCWPPASIISNAIVVRSTSTIGKCVAWPSRTMPHCSRSTCTRRRSCSTWASCRNHGALRSSLGKLGFTVQPLSDHAD